MNFASVLDPPRLTPVRSAVLLTTASREPVGLVWIVPERGVERVAPDAAGDVAAAFLAAAGNHRFGDGCTGNQLSKDAEPGV